MSAVLTGIGLPLPMILVVDLCVLGAVGNDVVQLLRLRSMEVTRELPERVGLSRELVRRLRFHHPRAAGLRARVHEEFPVPFEVTRRTVDGAWTAPAPEDPTGGEDGGEIDEAGSLDLARGYRSHLRGVFAFGDLRLRIRGPLGLLERQWRLAGPQEIGVEPALTDLKQTLRLAASERWHDLGVRLLKVRGGETEFESLREYVPGDEVRTVDWKAFARRGKPMVRQYQVERGQELILLVDRGRRMRATGSTGELKGWTKLDWALDAALQIAAVALSKGDRVGAAVFDRRLEAFVPPARHGRQLLRLSRALFHQQPTALESDLARALRELAARHRRRATVIIVSEVADPLSVEHQRHALAAASHRHRLVFAALDDPEVGAAAAGVGVTAPERAAALDLVRDRTRALRTLAGTGARVLDALPAQAAAPMLAAWLAVRRTAG